MNLKYNVLTALIFTITFNSFAQDRTFVWTYNSTVLAKGLKDLEAWGTYNTGKNYFYNRLDTRLEMEVGLTDRLQTAFYINGSHKAFGAYRDTLGGIADTSSSGIFSESEFSISSEWKWKLSDPVANKVGFSLYGELTLAPNALELEHKFIFDKKIENDVYAMNIVSEYVWEGEVYKGKKEMELDEIEGELDLAYLHFFKPTWGLGMEARYHNVFEGGKDWEHSGLFGGPTFYHSGEKYFLILNVMPQWANLKKSGDNPGHLDLAEYEKLSVRLLLGFGL